MLFVDSADKAARFIQTCNAFNIPLLFLADVPGFMIGTQVERQGIIRHGAKMITRSARRRSPSSVIVRKAYGAGLYAMAGPAFDPDACIALPTASIAVMGPQAAINAVFFNQIQAIEDEAERERRPPSARSTRRTSTSSTSPPSSSSTRSSSPRTCARSYPRRFARPRRSRATGRRSATRSTRSDGRAPVEPLRRDDRGRRD